ncbi:MAG: hypothetical protein J7499_04145 [Sphingopyxis sp.]|nr:hypothetical protein [Sphingopyxis sp.]
MSVEVKKHEFCSAAWVEQAERILNELAAEMGESLAGHSFCLCEVFTYAPLHLRDALACVAWHFVLADGRVQAALGERGDADLRIEADYETAASYARKRVPLAAGDAPPAASIKMTGDPASIPPPIDRLLAPLHNRLVSITA